jgi:hypothetical protein
LNKREKLFGNCLEQLACDILFITVYQIYNEDDHQLANFMKVCAHKAYITTINQNIQNEASIAAISASDKPRVWHITIPASDEGSVATVMTDVFQIN